MPEEAATDHETASMVTAGRRGWGNAPPLLRGKPMSQFLLHASTGVGICYKRHRILLPLVSHFAAMHNRPRVFARIDVAFCYNRFHFLLHMFRLSCDPTTAAMTFLLQP